MDSPGLVSGPVAGSCGQGNEPSGALKLVGFLDYIIAVLAHQGEAVLHGGRSCDGSTAASCPLCLAQHSISLL